MILTRYVGTLEVSSPVGPGAVRFRGTITTGTMWLSLWNNGSGAAAGSQLNLGNNLSELQGVILMLSSGYTTSGASVADGMVLVSNGAGGLNFNAINGAMRFYAGGASRALLDGQGISLENNHGFRIKNTGGNLIDGVVITSSNEIRVGSDNGANVVNTVLAAGSDLLFRTNSAIRGRFTAAGSFHPEGAGTQALGLSTNRWATAFVSSIDTGDIVFDNKFKLTEHDKVGIKVPGMALCNDQGEIVAFFDRKGTVYARGYAKLPELYEAGRRQP